MAAALILARKQDNFPRKGVGKALSTKGESIVKGLGADFDAPDGAADQLITGPAKRRGVLFKMVVTSDVVWLPREVTITDNALYISEVGNPRFNGPNSLDRTHSGSVKPAVSADAPKHVRSRRGSRVQTRNPRHKLDSASKAATIKPHDSPWSNIEGDSSFLFEVSTRPDGHNSGRMYRFKATGNEEVESWIADIEHFAKIASMAKSKAETVKPIEQLRRNLGRLYALDFTQMVVGGLIVLNFVASVFDAELLPEEGSQTKRVFEIFELTFTCLFSVELLVNLFVHWWRPFFMDAWNLFDGVVIVASLAAIAFEDLPGFNLFRLVRIFRVLRVFKRLASLRRIINALSSSVLPMLNAFTVLFLITAIYAILAVSIYKDQQPILFGSFLAAFFTMFQVCTMDGWATDIARELSDDMSVSFADGLFFVSFVVVVGIVILNVVVAVLLDEFVESVSKDRDERLEAKLQEQQKHRASYGSPLDPVLAALAHFNTNDDLSKRIQTMFQMFDVDQADELTYNDLMCGLRKLDIKPKIHLSKEDFDVITAGEGVLNDNGALAPAEFERVMRTELQRHVQRHLAHQMMSASASGSQIAHVLFVLKLMMVHIDELNQPQGVGGTRSPGAHSNWRDRFLGDRVRRGLSAAGSQTAAAPSGPAVQQTGVFDSFAHSKLDRIIQLLGGSPPHTSERTESRSWQQDDETLDGTESSHSAGDPTDRDSATPKSRDSKRGRLVPRHSLHTRRLHPGSSVSRSLSSRSKRSSRTLHSRIDRCTSPEKGSPGPSHRISEDVGIQTQSQNSMHRVTSPRTESRSESARSAHEEAASPPAADNPLGQMMQPSSSARLLSWKGGSASTTHFSSRSLRVRDGNGGSLARWSSAEEQRDVTDPAMARARDGGHRNSAGDRGEGDHRRRVAAPAETASCVPMEVVGYDSEVGSCSEEARLPPSQRTSARGAAVVQAKAEPPTSVRGIADVRRSAGESSQSSELRAASAAPARGGEGHRQDEREHRQPRPSIRRRSSPDPRRGREPRRQPSHAPPVHAAGAPG